MRSLHETPASLTWYPDALRANGYYTANFTKTDYNTATRRTPGFGGGENEGTCWNYLNTWDSHKKDCWKNPNRKPDQPFFQVLNLAGCHESHLHKDNNTNKDVDPVAMKLAPYHPDIPEMRTDYARYAAGVMGADQALGRILAKLEADGFADDTIVIYTSDNGGVIGRSKRFLYDSGTYRVQPEPPRQACFAIHQATNLVVRGAGKSTRLVITDPASGGFGFGLCRQVVVCDLVLDCDPVPFCQGTTCGVENQAGSCNLEVEPGYPTPDADNFLKAIEPCGAGFEIRRNHMNGNRRYGCLLRAGNGVVKDNVFEDTPVRDLVIESNEFLDSSCDQLMALFRSVSVGVGALPDP